MDLLAARPVIDWAVPLGIVTVWFFVLEAPVPVAGNAKDVLYTAVSSAAGVALAAATFACTFMYRSPSELVRRVLHKFGSKIARNWFSILSALLFATFAPLISLTLAASVAEIAFGIVVFSGTMILTKFMRVIFWVRYTLSIEYRDRKIYKTRRLKYESFPSSS